MKIKSALKTTTPVAIALAVGTIAGASLGFGLADDGSEKSDSALRAEDPSVSISEFSVNTAGKTYGSLADSTSISNFPDLILVGLSDGSEGYVLAVDLFEAENSLDDPASPLEAVRQSQSLEAEGPVALDVYDKDGNATGATWWAITGK